ncbi:uncharacterized protein BHQ10_004936 [Talaromyces amestolkiae]|uniref:Leucine rich repeat protein n=1 Tax=Talaromyces amestolkiae TaxID=1196081 RepID=A0A364KZG3_TALAM|nr:uncharacterized protein BHQ10_004936 [Talaromyces amestolkiae]RAO68924.1 hypothetical protein BHQ10_004936 [Talaromyces amestolkiae]
MARLNYTARKISGVKAGLAVKKDLNKRIPSTPNFKIRDPILEIDVSGKDLTDDGFNEFILDLQIAVEYKSPHCPQGINKLQELHLQGNRLTVNTLVELAKVINLSSRDLKELDISNNEIKIVTASDSQKWRYFLQSFGQCCVLKKIDFSGNALGPLGIELLARFYIRSELDFVEIVEDGEGDGDVPEDLMREHSQHEDEPGVAGHETKSARQVSPQTTGYKHHTHTDAELRRYACTRGLRSVPYLIVQDVGIANGSIVHLAEMVRLHRAPENLLSFLPGGKPPSLPPIEQGRCGIYWQPNNGLGVLSHRLMKLTEEIKLFTTEADSEDDLVEDFEGLDIDFDHEEIERAQEERERRRRLLQKLTVDLGRTISQQRIHVLGTEGLRKSILWHCALRMLAIARTILLAPENRPPSAEDELITVRRNGVTAAQTRVPQARSPFSNPITTRTVLGAPSNHVYAGTRERSGRSTEAVLSVADLQFPITQPSARRQHCHAPPRGGALISSFRFDPQSSTFDVMFPAIHRPFENPLIQIHPPPVAAVMPNYPQEDVGEDSGRNGSKQSNTTVKTTENYRSKYRFGLSLHLWQRIISESMNLKPILHPDQQSKVINYAASWGALEAEMSINGAAENQQIWKILDSIDCFTYKPLS